LLKERCPYDKTMVVNWGWLSLLRAANDGDMIGNVNIPPAQNLRAFQWLERLVNMLNVHVQRDCETY
jgi:hypothetical protein